MVAQEGKLLLAGPAPIFNANVPARLLLMTLPASTSWKAAADGPGTWAPPPT